MIIHLIEMKKINKLRICNAFLAVMAALMLLSGLQLEACGGRDLMGIGFNAMVWAHSIAGAAMMAAVAWHLYLHFGRGGWLKKMRRLKNRPTRAMCVLWGVMAVLSIAALAHFVLQPQHSPLGAVHGKAGFLFLLFCIGHTAKRWRWLKTHVLRGL